MATFIRRGNSWQAKVRRKGHRIIARTFDTKASAEKWARATERELDQGTFIPSTAAERTTMAEAITLYEEEVLPRLAKGGKASKSILGRLRAELGPLSLAVLDSSHITVYKEKMLKTYSLQTVRHDLGFLQRILRFCQIERGIHLPRGLPTTLVKLPKMPRARDRRLKRSEESKLLKAASDYEGDIADIIAFAIETAMRRAEIAQMRWEHVNLARRVVLLPETKSGEPRRVPLSSKAITILDIRKKDLGPVWEIQHPASITKAFVRVCTRAKLEDLRFHDLRHEATSRLFEKGLNMMEVAAITGHKTLIMLKRYTHLRAEDLAQKLG